MMERTDAGHTLEIRLAAGADAEALTALYRQLTGDARTRVLPERLDALADGARAQVLVCACGTELAGTAWLGFCEDVMYGAQPFAVLENVVVDARWRGRGLGAALLREAERRSLARDCSKIMLLSSAGREDAHRFFLRAGFRGDAKRGFVKYRRDMGGDGHQ
ncbi:GNAT family N-acetyltransferase [Chromobacterium violaceum]|uniref:Acetyltransferase n=1 Tax=Chromobacterium violaceum TaxID=536 RepID=A0AAX2M692_CHRVL|nr:GNAT family N-acetyltransferase [Chromobacterium violaceum]MBX9266587.1 GNAT family N-acetyltransferase [Chromobacterium violaceum]STB64302.1 putative acetyltransferase [Chromobacterium violaceum]SUX31922.1 putative acetyltransferase [Chromobacterium violaceum]